MNLSTELNLQDKVSNEPNRARRPKSGGKVFLYFVLLFLLWGGLVYEGFYFTKHYFDQTINNIQQTNAMHMQEVNEKLAGLTNELYALQQAINNTDKTLSSSGDIQEELNKKILVLDEQLKALEKSLKILKEAP